MKSSKAAPRGMTVSQRIGWHTGPRLPSGCREWTGTINNHGYAFIWADGKYVHALRPILGLKHGDGIVGMHSCDNRKCVEPSHLRRGTTAENVADARAKGRHAFGERGGHAVITEETVRRFHALRAGGRSLRQIAHETGVNANTVAAAVSGRNWMHLRPRSSP